MQPRSVMPVCVGIAVWGMSLTLLPSIIRAEERRSDVPLRIVVRSAQTKHLAQHAYIGVVPSTRAWARPLIEQMSASGSAIVHVPSGTYRVLAGTADLGMTVSAPVVVAADRQNHLEIELQPLVRVSGTVRDPEGRAIEGVTIADVDFRIEPPLGRLSEMAARVLAVRGRTVSAADGTWALMRAPETTNPIVAEHDGHEPAWHPMTSGPSRDVDLVLHPGARLRARLDRADPELVVTLSLREGPASVPQSWRTQLWARRAATGAVEWTSLPAGTYDIFAQARDFARLPKAVRIGSILLDAGEAREIEAALPPPPTSAAGVISFFLPAIAPQGLADVEVFGRASSGAPTKVRSAAEEVSGGTLIHLDTTTTGVPHFGVTRDAFIAFPVGTQSNGTAIDPPLAAVAYRRGSGRLRIRSAVEDVGLPGSGMATVLGCEQGGPVPIPVAVEPGGVVSFEAPANCTHVSLAFAPFGLVLLHAPIAPRQQAWLGDVLLYPAAAADVRATFGEGSPAVEAEVTVYARTDETDVPLAATKTNADGWASFEELPAGRELTLRARDEAGNRSLPRTIRLQPRERALIDPLPIVKRSTLLIEPDLAGDFMVRYPRAWIERVVIEPDRGAPTLRSRSERVSRSGVAEFRDVDSGRWNVVALVRDGNRLHPVRGDRPVIVEAGTELALSMTFSPLVFRGRVIAGDRNLEGNIDIFGSRSSDILPSVPLSAEGNFEALLPRRDVYQVGVRARSSPGSIWVGEVAFRDPAEVVEIHVPATTLLVQVRNQDGPLADLPLLLRAQRPASEGIQRMQTVGVTDGRGEARVEGLLAGVWILSAVDPETRKQAEKTVTVGTEETLRVELFLEQAAVTVSGVIREPFGAPAVASSITCVLPGPDETAYTGTATASDDGAFEFDVSPLVPRAPISCGVRSGGRVQAYRVMPDEPAELILPSQTAALTVIGMPRLHRLSGVWLVSLDRGLIDVTSFVREDADGAVLAIPAVAAGRWKVVRVSSLGDWVALTRGGPWQPLLEVTIRAGDDQLVDLSDAERRGVQP